MMGRPAEVALQLMIDAHALDSTVDELAVETDEIFATLLDHRLQVMPGLLELLCRAGTRRNPQGNRHQQRSRFRADGAWKVRAGAAISVCSHVR